MTRKVHPNAAAPAREPPRIASCCGGDDAWGKDSAVVLTVWRKSLLFSCSGFTVFDAKGDLVFRVETYGSGTAGELVLMDAAGKPLLTLRRKVLQRLSLGENWLIYDGEDAGNPLYSVRKHVNLLRCKALAHVTPCGSDGCGGYEVEGSYSRRSCTVFDDRGRAVAEVQQKEAVGGVAFGGEVFRLVVQPDMNACLAMAVLIVLDQIITRRRRLNCGSVMEKYEKLEKVGEGTYGKVYKAKDKATGQLVALKKTRLQMDEEGIPPTSLREISLLQLLSRSIYIVRLLNVEQVKKNNKPILYLVFEYVDTDLKKFIDSFRRGSNPRPIPSPVIQSFLYQLCKGVAHCHGHGVLHRDLKPQNLLVDKEKGILKIADLGLGRAFTIPLKSYTHEIVTLWYRAPEVLLGTTHYSTGVDMWSIGCIFAEMVRSQLLFPGDSELQQLLHIFRLLGTPTEEQWPGVGLLRDWHEYPQWKPQNLARAVPALEPEGVDLLSKMLQYDPANRISAKAAMEHPYFDSLDKSQF
ncbi:unnamed protein product [Musa acuminata subsp. burmannicoides]